MAVGDAHVFPGFLTPVLTQLSFQSHRLLFSHASEVRGENTSERKFDATGVELKTTGSRVDTLTTEIPGRGDRSGAGRQKKRGGIPAHTRTFKRLDSLAHSHTTGRLAQLVERRTREHKIINCLSDETLNRGPV